MPIAEDEPQANPLPKTESTPAPPTSSYSVWFWTHTRRAIVFVFGGTLLIFGLVGVLLPVLPGWPFLFAGLAVLATEFAWARWVLKMAKERASQLMSTRQTKNARSDS